jgi:SAM-dependent methyltransferase
MYPEYSQSRLLTPDPYIVPGVRWSMQVTRCQVCQCEVGAFHVVREMALGTRDEFLYFECSGCECLSLAEIPPDLDRYYHSPQPRPLKSDRMPRLRKLRDAIYLSPLSFLVNWHTCGDLDVIRQLQLTKKMSFLDVGCGAGRLVSHLRELGYNAHGIDPHLSADLKDQFGVCAECKSLAEVKTQYDAILLRHTLEQMPIDGLRLARNLVKDNGTCVVSIPLLGWGWRAYTTNWVQLNAPRHLFIHSAKSFLLLAQSSGFRIEHVVFDSTEFQFWASESYQQGVPLEKLVAPTRSQRRRIRRLAKSLNLKHQGDCAKFYLKPI